MGFKEVARNIKTAVKREVSGEASRERFEKEREKKLQEKMKNLEYMKRESEYLEKENKYKKLKATNARLTNSINKNTPKKEKRKRGLSSQVAFLNKLSNNLTVEGSSSKSKGKNKKQNRDRFGFDLGF